MSITSSIQGFAVEQNLAENKQDRAALNNLGTAPIADDISLFVNNLKNTSVLSFREDEYEVGDGLFTLNNVSNEEKSERNSIFTNGDQVMLIDVFGAVVGTDLVVINSDAERQFQLSQNGVDPFKAQVPPDVGDEPYIFSVVRNDSVTLENIANLAKELSQSIPTVFTEDTVENIDDLFGRIGSFAGSLSEIQLLSDTAIFKTGTKYTTDGNIYTDEGILTEGNIVISDPSDTILNEGLVATSPGLYLSDPTSSPDDQQGITVTRAFSSNSNPWTDDLAGTLSTESTQVTVGDLRMSNGFILSGITTATVASSDVVESFTHKIAIAVDGEVYFLCLSAG